MAVQRGYVQCNQGAYGESAFEELDEVFILYNQKNIYNLKSTFLT